MSPLGPIDQPAWQPDEYTRWLQHTLSLVLGVGVPESGFVDPETRRAIQAFQRGRGLPEDGAFGPATTAALMASISNFGGDSPVPAQGWENQEVQEQPASARPTGGAYPTTPPSDLTAAEHAQLARLTRDAQTQFNQLRRDISGYTGVARREAERGLRVLLLRGLLRTQAKLLSELIQLSRIARLPPGWTANARALMVGNVLYNLAFPETINQGGNDRLGGKPDLTCFSASTQILLARRFPATYVRLTVELATTRRCTFPGGDTIGPLEFRSTSLYKSLESVLLQTAFDTFFKTRAIVGSYTPGDELKVHRQVFGLTRPPRYATYQSRAAMTAAFRRAFVINGGNTRLWEIANLCTGSQPQCGNHCVVVTRCTNGRVYFYNPWANEEEKNTMFGSSAVSVSGFGERPAESSMSQADFENQLTTVFHN
ncbi:MAG: peptidoglycan-binding protein [Chloroflexi bacterium]|nr:peptidoglycan-binding protein [Chloroflexota bacterium]